MAIIISNPKLSFIALFLILATFKLAHSQDVTSFTFDSFASNPTDLTYQGDARVLPGSRTLTLAGTEPSGEPKNASVGRVLYSKPVKFYERSPPRQASFETTLRFRIRPSVNGAADGLAFFITTVNSTIPEGTIGGNLGIYNMPHLFAVEFDTQYNAWDPVYHHIGINVESRVSRNVTRFNAGTGQLVTARINYVANTRTITVVATSASQTAEVSHVFDLKSVLHENVQVGVTASSGWYLSYVGIPEIVSWYFTSSLVYDSVDKDEDTYIRQYGQI